jgi:ABC-type antimicrobial peptide transport system permease subunit
MVSKNYKYTYGLEEGQIITIDLSPEIKNQKFILAGFIDIEYEHFVYSNLADKLDEVGLNYNSIVIKDDAPNILMSNLIQQYSSKMYYIIDVNEYLNQEIVLSENILMLFTVILIFVILSYLLVIFNNTTLRFYAAKKDLMKIKVLGQSSKAFLKDGLKEYLLILIILTLVGIIVTLIFSEYFRYLLLFFNYYKHLTANISSVIIALILIYLSSFLSVIYYNRLIKNARISDTIKMY